MTTDEGDRPPSGLVHADHARVGGLVDKQRPEQAYCRAGREEADHARALIDRGGECVAGRARVDPGVRPDPCELRRGGVPGRGHRDQTDTFSPAVTSGHGLPRNIVLPRIVLPSVCSPQQDDRVGRRES